MSGQFVWFDLCTPDAEASKAFYTEVVGWSMTPFKPGYEMFTGGEGPVGGLEVTEEGEPHWLAYLSVDDVDATYDAALKAGASGVVPPYDVPEVGRMATLADPHGARIAIFKSANPDEQGAMPVPEGRRPPGHVAWRELMAGDLDEAWAFYTQLFGFAGSGSMDMGEAGEYRMFSAGGHGGGVMNAAKPGPAPTWLYYFNVPSLDDALARAQASGAKLNHGPIEVPGGDRVALFTDPQGADFALHEYAGA